MLRYRLLFGPLMIAAAIGLVYVDDLLDRVVITGTVWQRVFAGREYPPSGLVLLLLVLVLIPLAAREMVKIFHSKGVDVPLSTISIAGIVGCVSVYIVPFRTGSPVAMAVVTTLIVLVLMGALIRHAVPRKRTQGAVMVAAATMLAMVYLGVLPGFYFAIRRWHSAWVVLGVILIAKSCDIGAYFTGRAIGRHKLIPWLSPGKTWEGLVGGVATSSLVALGMIQLGVSTGVLGVWTRTELTRHFTPYGCPWWYALLAGASIGLVGQAGDLIASLFKRDAGIKDSGDTVPGFGGVIDVLDSAIAIAPLAYWLLIGLHGFAGQR
ncbi:MAG: hypothetical protein GC164_07030 [Phycisphaera sp.]|nr:hypothetical protein [Phycisphaera sp.]